MVAISIEKQRKRLPFLKLCLADGWAGAGGQGQTSQKKIYEMLPINIGKQRKRPPFFKSCVGDQTNQTKIYYRIVHFYYFKCFRLVLKSKGNACLFSTFVFWRTDGRGAGGRRGQTCQTEIYYRIVHF